MHARKQVDPKQNRALAPLLPRAPYHERKYYHIKSWVEVAISYVGGWKLANTCGGGNKNYCIAVLLSIAHGSRGNYNIGIKKGNYRQIGDRSISIVTCVCLIGLKSEVSCVLCGVMVAGLLKIRWGVFRWRHFFCSETGDDESVKCWAELTWPKYVRLRTRTWPNTSAGVTYQSKYFRFFSQRHPATSKCIHILY